VHAGPASPDRRSIEARPVAGLDGRRAGGWVGVRLEGNRLGEIREFESFADVFRAWPDCAVFGIDIPIGHDDPTGSRNRGVREADHAAKRLLGGRHSTVFLVPPPQILDAGDYAEARRRAREADLSVPSAQVFEGLRRRIAEIEPFSSDPRVHEVHPELSFRRMSELNPGLSVASKKDTWNGIYERLALLHAVGLRPARSMGGLGRASPDDVLDATAVGWTACRIRDGTAERVPPNPPKDPRTGRTVAIWR
jgi:predicted RNase H-like nuclease